MNESDHRVVITGMGLVSPLGRHLEQVWDHVERGHTGVSRWDGGPTHLPDLPIALAGEYANEPSRGTRFAVECSLDALRDAGLETLGALQATRFGLALGNSKGNVLSLEKALTCMTKNDVAGIPPETMDNFFHHGANVEVMRRTGICGPCVSLVGACSTGAYSVIQGVHWIQDGQADYVLAGAAESSLSPLVLSGFDQMGVLSKTRNSPYDRGRNGFVIGEGAGVVVLERLSSALARDARIYAEISGWGIASDSYKPVSFEPGGISIEKAARSCVTRAKSEVPDMDYINCHGTGTRENDIIETTALKRLLAPGVQKTALSSTKPMTGHLLGAAGSVELILTALSLKNNFVPATLHLEDPDTLCDLDYTAKEGRAKRIQNAMSLSYGFGGHVAAIALRKI